MKNTTKTKLVLLSKSNVKLSKDNIVSFSILPGITCVNCKVKNCFAEKMCRIHPNVAKKWGTNLAVTQNRSLFVTRMTDELKTLKPNTIVRIHVGGDFYSQDYLNDWLDLVQRFKGLKFYCYTKSLHLDWTRALTLSNLSVVQSEGGEYDRLIDWNRPVAKVVQKTDSTDGMVIGNESDTIAAKAKGKMIIALIQH